MSLFTVAAVFSPGLSGGFILDDFSAIVQNSSVHIRDLSAPSIQQAWGGFIFGASGRPLAMLSFGIDHVIWGANPFGYKLSSLIWHLLNALLIMLLAHRLLDAAGALKSDGFGRNIPILFGLLWAIHPLQASTVLYVVQRMEIMALSFTLLALLSYLHGRKAQLAGQRGGWAWLALTAVFSYIALWCKETGALVPLFALCLELTVFGFRAQRRDDAMLLRLLYGAGIVVTAFYFVSTIWPRYTGPEAYLSRDFSWQERLLTQMRTLPMYLGWIVWPDPQRYQFYYDAYPKSTGWLQPVTTLLGGLFLAGLLALGLLVRRAMPLVSLGILWFFAAHFLSSNIVPLELVFEHRNYFAVFAAILIGFDLVRRVGLAGAQLPMPAISLALAVGLAVLTLITSATWGNPLTLALDLRGKNPGSERAIYDLADIYRGMSNQNPSSPFFDMARTSFVKAAEIPGSSPMPEQALIAMKGLANLPARDEWWDRLIEKVETGPRGPMQISAVRTLLALYNNEVPLDPDRLMDAGIALLNKPGLNPSIHFEFALHALTALEDESLAAQILIVGSTIAGDPAWDNTVTAALAGRGHEEFALRLASRLRGGQ